ncbi:MAG: hypothetical protein KZQ99_18430, partial [Candidatus Thiodiazotropha sp. (ex Dulcina madagascariensis)]|nr:hypothetical protein [Candidatus Thiodiazotropha sp. (ex Dulcina madagascariensis)]
GNLTVTPLREPPSTTHRRNHEINSKTISLAKTPRSPRKNKYNKKTISYNFAILASLREFFFPDGH